MNENKQGETIDKSKEAVKQDAKGLWESFKTFMNELLDFRHDTDQEATIEAIKSDIALKGATAWILIFAVFIASIGLNVSSTAVVIGAMLISPLMGPILGIGMSLAINDIDTLKSSFVNLLVMMVLSVITAYLYFLLSPLTELTPELEARTQPNILDVLVAIFGGLALIVARTKKGTIASVIFGVAIATALMPPLCTAGYGLAVGNISFFLGAMYLFAINTTFIALSTFLVLKVLGFTMIRYVNSKKRRRIAQMATFFGLIAMVPAVWTFLNVLEKSGYERDFKDFVEKEILSNDDLWLQRNKLNIDDRTINLYFNGKIEQATVTDLTNELDNYERIKDFELNINANESRSADDISKSLTRAYADIDEKNNIINGLQKEISDYKKEVSDLKGTIELADRSNIPFIEIAKEAKIRFSEITEIRFSKVLSTKDFIKIDTIPEAKVTWDKKVKKFVVFKKQKELHNWLQKEMKLDTLILRK
ncbi:DUF389 domain-containing protein [Tenacibaculum agarivorans]|uniref:DUF389 domain-containing protein n=1 Tax=Tenacibaculum agarivorans TaxID=1908389 RepID=UPI00094BC35A|nr:DUF389 domain-containing protein [Tenacibaculum agarivorans]